MYDPDELDGLDDWRTQTEPQSQPCRVCREWTEDGTICLRCAMDTDELDELFDDDQ